MPRPSSAQSIDYFIPDAAVEDPDGWLGPEEPEFPQPDNADEPSGEQGWISTEPQEPQDAWPGEVAIEPPLPIEPDGSISLGESEIYDAMPATEMESVSLAPALELGLPATHDAFPELEEFLLRFTSLSEIADFESSDGEFAQLNLLAREDEQLLRELLQVYGYFDARITRSIRSVPVETSAEASLPIVRFEIHPETQFRFGEVNLGNLKTTNADYETLRMGFEIYPGDPVRSDAIVTERVELQQDLGELGYPFAEVGDPSLTLDRDRAEAHLDMPVEPGGKYRFGAVVSLQPDFLSSPHLTRLAGFELGEIYDQTDAEDLRRTILSTGLVSSVQITPREVAPPEGNAPGVADLAIDMAAAPLRTITAHAGYGTDKGFEIGAGWEHRNLFPPEGMLGVRGILGTREQTVEMIFRRNNLGGRERILSFELSGDNRYRKAYRARSATLAATYEKRSTIFYQRQFSWGLGVEAVVTDEAEKNVLNEVAPRKTYKVGALPLFGLYDTTTDLLDPVSGFKVGLQLSPEVSLQGGESPTYFRARLDGSTYLRLGGGAILALRGALGSIVGVEIGDIAPSRRLYAGGENSVRGYGYEIIGLNDDPDKPNGGRSLAEISLEARIPTALFDGALSVVPFMDAGQVGPGTTPKFDDLRWAAGLGIRYNTGIGPFRLDVGFPLNPRPQHGWISVYVSLGQAF